MKPFPIFISNELNLVRFAPGLRDSMIRSILSKGGLMSQPRITTYAEAMKQANREAKSTVVALFAIIVVWLLCGFGLCGLDIWVFHTPLWVLGGCVAPWIAAVIAAIVLGHKVFVDFDLDSVAEASAVDSGSEGMLAGGAAAPASDVTISSSGEGGGAHHG